MDITHPFILIAVLAKQPTPMVPAITQFDSMEACLEALSTYANHLLDVDPPVTASSMQIGPHYEYNSVLVRSHRFGAWCSKPEWLHPWLKRALERASPTP